MLPFLFFFFNDTATTEIYTLSLHDALPISENSWPSVTGTASMRCVRPDLTMSLNSERSEEHTSELQSPVHLVCRLLLEKKNVYLVLPHTKHHLHTHPTPYHSY